MSDCPLVLNPSQTRAVLRLMHSAWQEGIFTTNTAPHLVATSSSPPMTWHLGREEGSLAALYRGEEGVSLAFSLPDGSVFTSPLCLWDGPLQQGMARTLGDSFSPDQWQRAREELQNSLAGEEASAQAQSVLYAHLKDAMDPAADSFLGWLHSGQAQPWLDEAGYTPASLLLQIGSFAGHRTHPAPKMKMLLTPGNADQRAALTVADLHAVAPEFAPDVAVILLAVHKTQVTTSVMRAELDYKTLFSAHYPQEMQQWATALHHLGLSAQEYQPVPVHPLQMPQVQQRFASAFESINLVETHVALKMRPTISLRTLTPVENEKSVQIKLPIHMQMTSVVRTLAPSRSYNSPVLSAWCQDILDNEPDIAAKLRFALEPASIYWGKDVNPHSRDYADGYHLGCVLRENPDSKLWPGEYRIPLATLLSPSPLSGMPLICEVFMQSGCTLADFFQDYSRLVTGTDLALLIRQGLSLESHQQNCDLIFSADFQPKALLYRDINGGLEICEPIARMNGHDLAGRLHPVAKCLQPDLTLPLAQTLHTSFASHLIPVAEILAHHAHVPPRHLYQIVADQVREGLTDARIRHSARLAPEYRAAYQAHVQQIEAALFGPHLKMKNLLTMRATQSQVMRFGTLDNPLHGIHQPVPQGRG